MQAHVLHRRGRGARRLAQRSRASERAQPARERAWSKRVQANQAQARAPRRCPFLLLARGNLSWAAPGSGLYRPATGAQHRR